MNKTNHSKFLTLSLIPLAIAISACGSSDDGGISGSGSPTVVDSTGNMDSVAAPADSTDTNASPGDTDADGNTGTDTTDIDGTTNNTDTDGTTDNTDTDDTTGNTNPTDTTDTTDNTSDPLSDSSVVTGSDRGLLATATPQFKWDAVEGADSYQIRMFEQEGNPLTYIAGTDACAGTECSATPTAAYHDNIISWKVDALSGGQILQSTDNGNYATPRSFALTPETSNAEVCEIWPSISYDDVIVLNNIWNNRTMTNPNWTQQISAVQSSEGVTTPTWDYNWLTRTDGPESDVKAYPQIIYGNKLGTHVSADKSVTGLPEVANNLPEFVVDFGYTETFNGEVERNVALESFFHDSCNITGPCDFDDNRAFEMMIWVETPNEKKPGSLAATGVEIDNRLWDVYIKPGNFIGYIAFTAQTGFGNGGTINWNRFVEWTIAWTQENYLAEGILPLNPDMCMAAIEMGTEMWWGEGSFTLDRFDVSFDR